MDRSRKMRHESRNMEKQNREMENRLNEIKALFEKEQGNYFQLIDKHNVYRIPIDIFPFYLFHDFRSVLKIGKVLHTIYSIKFPLFF